MTLYTQKLTDITVLLLRIATGIIFIQTGGLKVFGWFGGMPPNGAKAELMSQAGIGGLLEIVGGILIILGLFTRIVAFILAGEMAVAYWQFHFPMGNWPIQNHGEPAVLSCFIFLFLAAYGAGIYSLDKLLFRRRV
jgi:putative oxidoreductase